MRISEIIHDRVERYRDRTFLKAAMAASALTAYADGSVSVTERFKVDGDGRCSFAHDVCSCSPTKEAAAARRAATASARWPSTRRAAAVWRG